MTNLKPNIIITFRKAAWAPWLFYVQVSNANTMRDLMLGVTGVFVFLMANNLIRRT